MKDIMIKSMQNRWKDFFKKESTSSASLPLYFYLYLYLRPSPACQEALLSPFSSNIERQWRGPLKEIQDERPAAHELVWILASPGLELSVVLAIGFGTTTCRGVLKTHSFCCYFDSFWWERAACKHFSLECWRLNLVLKLLELIFHTISAWLTEAYIVKRAIITKILTYEMFSCDHH